MREEEEPRIKKYFKDEVGIKMWTKRQNNEEAKCRSRHGGKVATSKLNQDDPDQNQN